MGLKHPRRVHGKRRPANPDGSPSHTKRPRPPVPWPSPALGAAISEPWASTSLAFPRQPTGPAAACQGLSGTHGRHVSWPHPDHCTRLRVPNPRAEMPGTGVCQVLRKGGPGGSRVQLQLGESCMPRPRVRGPPHPALHPSLPSGSSPHMNTLESSSSQNTQGRRHIQGILCPSEQPPHCDWFPRWATATPGPQPTSPHR